MYRFNHPSAPNTGPEQKPEQSNRSTTPGGLSWKKALAISALPLALLFGAAFQSSNSVPGQLQAIQSQISTLLSQNSALGSQISALQAQVTSLANDGPRKFYLTKTVHTGSQALSACAGGYHMASMGEIQETSNLRYNTDLGLTAPDSGFGPPFSDGGWIRTGFFAEGSPIPGLANCHAWTSADGVKAGTAVARSITWTSAAATVSPWSAFSLSCADTARVWCVQD